MECLLNLAWALCSCGLIWLWWRNRDANPEPVRVQVLALAMVVLLLLPVISLSDDLLSMQGTSETDSSVRRVLHADDTHPSASPSFLAVPEAIVIALPSGGLAREALQAYRLAPAPVVRTRSLDSRPPPQA